MLLFLALIALTGTAIAEDNKCAGGWTYYAPSDTCMWWGRTGAKFVEAMDICRGHGGDLIKVDSKEKNDFALVMTGHTWYVWIGVWDQFHNQRWSTTDGMPLEFELWSYGEPNNAYGREACCQLEGKKERWNDVSCDRGLSFLCERPASYVPPTTAIHETTEVEIGCSEGWIEHEENEVCIKVFQEKASFKGAREICRQQEADLVTMFHNKEEKDFVKELTTKRVNYWIGIHAPNKDMDYQFVDGSELTFTAFRRGEPNSYKGKEHCIDMMNGKWFDKKCGTRRFFICQKRVHRI